MPPPTDAPHPADGRPDWARVRALFDTLQALAPVQREAALAASTAPPAVQQEVRSLLAHADDAGGTAEGFLEAPAAAAGLWSAALPEAPSRTGQRVGPWQIDHLLGRGGMGEVWCAHRADGAYAGQVAIKLLHAGLDSQRVLARFGQEQRALARLNHPHIARLLDVGRTPDGLPCIVMEHVAGRPIDQACAGQPLARRLALFLQLADAVAHAHRALLVHRDLKPGNVLVTDDGQVKLLDFGIAKALDPLEGRDGDATVAGERPFTPHYASPEQVRGEPVGTATDIYSLGVLLYLLLTGQRPYGRQASSAAEAARCVLEEAPMRPSALTADSAGTAGRPGLATDPQWLATRRRLQGDLDNVLLKALDKSPEGRYASVDAFAADLRAYLAGFPVSARPAGWAYRARKFVGRHRLGVGLAGVALVALVGALGLALWQQQQAEQARALAERQRQQAEQQRAVALQRFDQVRQLARQLVFKYHDQVENLPGAARVREALLTDAAAFLDGLRQSADGDPALAAELAGTYYRISRLQGLDQSVNTGQHAAARVSLGKALALTAAYVQRPDVPMPALTEAVNMHISHGEVFQRRGEMARADTALREGLPLLARALARDGRDSWALASAISLHGVHARILGNQLGHASLGRWRQACASADAARAAADATLAADPANVYAPDSLAFTLGEQAHCRLLAGRLDEAQALLVQQQGLREQMVQRFPDDQDFRWQLARVQADRAQVLGAQGRHAEALAHGQLAARQARAVAAADPGNAAAQRRLWALDLLQARLMADAGQAGAARAAVQRLLQRWPAPTEGADMPAFADLRPRAEALLWAARLWRTADPARARRWADEAEALMQPATPADDNASRRWLQAQAQGESAAALAALGRSPQARARAAQALAVWDDPAAPEPPPLLLPWRAQAASLAGAGTAPGGRTAGP